MLLSNDWREQILSPMRVHYGTGATLRAGCVTHVSNLRQLTERERAIKQTNLTTHTRTCCIYTYSSSFPSSILLRQCTTRHGMPFSQERPQRRSEITRGLWYRPNCSVLALAGLKSTVTVLRNWAMNRVFSHNRSLHCAFTDHVQRQRRQENKTHNIWNP